MKIVPDFVLPTAGGALGATLALIAVVVLLPPAADCPCDHTPAVIQSQPADAEPTPAIAIDGPDEAAPGELVKLSAKGEAKWAWGGTRGSELLLKGRDFFTAENEGLLFFSTAKPGAYVFWLAGANELVPHPLTVKGAEPVVEPKPVEPPPVTPPVVTPDPIRKATRATYIYEQRRGSVPPPVAAALSKLNAAGVVASAVDQDVISGKGQAPAQYATALAEAKKAGLPCLVVEYASGAPKVVAAPTTEAQVMEAVK